MEVKGESDRPLEPGSVGGADHGPARGTRGGWKAVVERHPDREAGRRWGQQGEPTRVWRRVVYVWCGGDVKERIGEQDSGGRRGEEGQALHTGRGDDAS